MSVSDVLARYGTWALLRFVVTVLLFVALHLLQLPFVWIARLLDACKAQVDRAVTAQVSTPGVATAGAMPGGGVWEGTR